jgi:LacI family transcriptional regulator
MTTPASRHRATMSDVARLAGVSLKTVSRVVNEDGYVSAATLVSVKSAIDALGFRRNEVARQLRQGRTATIGLVVEDQSDPFYSYLARSVEDIALANGFLLLSASSNEDPERSRRIVDTFSARGAAGIILAPAQGTDPALLRAELDAGSALVFVDRPVPGVLVDTVLADNIGGMAAGTSHLIDHGHRRIGLFCDDASVFTAGERQTGYRSALEAAGVAYDPELVVMMSPTHPSAAEQIDRMLASTDPPTAVLAGNNRWSIALLRHLKSLDRAIPRAFVGFDDFELSDVLDPGITVIAQDPAEMGRLAVELLLERVAGDDRPLQQIRLTPRLIERGSGELSGPAAAS